jgi:hypothetical protein
MVVHSLHRRSESLVNALERVMLRVVQEIMKNQYSPSGPALGSHKGELSLRAKCHTRFRKGNRMHPICAPGSSFAHIVDVISEYPKQCIKEIE